MVGGHLGFPIGTILTSFDLQVNPMLPTVSSQLAFWYGGHLGFLIGPIWAIFDLQVSLMRPTKFRVNWSIGSEVAENRFSRWPPFPIGKISANFDLQVTTMLPTKFRSNWLFGSEEAKNRFSRWPSWRPSWTADRNDFSYFFFFYLQVTPMLPTEFRVNWPFGWGEEAKNIFSKWRPCRPSWISNYNDFSYFWSTSHPDASYQVSSQ